MSSEAKQIALDWVDEYKELLIEVHNKVWEYAEVGLQEYKTSRFLADILERNGFRIEMGIAGMPTAFVATWGEGRPIIGVMAELDALPGLSQKSVPHREPVREGAPGHGCGHHGYAAAALGGVLAAKEAMERLKLPGTLKCFGCPAEETVVGKVFMVREGVFDGLDACLGHHPSQINSVSLKSSNAMNSVKFEFFGIPSHAAGSPEQGRSALDAVELMNIGVNYLREHVIDKARIHYIIEVGGLQPNIVPEYARVWYYVRAPERDIVESIYKRVLKIADGAALMSETRYRVRFLTGVYNTIPNKTLAELIVTNMKEIGPPKYDEEELKFARELGKTIPREEKINALRRIGHPELLELVDVDLCDKVLDPWGEGMTMAGSSDVADVSWNTPTLQFGTTMFILGAPGHSWQNVASGGMSIGHKSTLFASKVMAATIVDLITKPETLGEAQEEWRSKTRGLEYRSPLPSDLKPPLDQLPPMSEKGN
jgi:aminobenzoyl-glutamate utilization protein B